MQAVIELQRRMPNARILYVSATGATESANLGYMQRLGLWGPGTAFQTRDEFVRLLNQRGVGEPQGPACCLRRSPAGSPPSWLPHPAGRWSEDSRLYQSELRLGSVGAFQWVHASVQSLRVQADRRGNLEGACTSQQAVMLRCVQEPWSWWPWS